MPIVQTVIEHHQVTSLHQLHYQFTPKHHGFPGPMPQAQWIPALTFDDEFAVFDEADTSGICDEKGHMYGVRRDPDGELRELGMWEEQVAKFPHQSHGPWHGYPCWAINKEGPSNRRKQEMLPPRQAFDLLQKSGLITEEQRDRLRRGDHA